MKLHIMCMNYLPFVLRYSERIRTINTETKRFTDLLIIFDVLIVFPMANQKESMYQHGKYYTTPEFSPLLSHTKSKIVNSVFLHKLIQYNNCQMNHSKQSSLLPSHNDLIFENQKISRELADIKMELYEVYQDNVRLRQVVKQQESDKQFIKECENQLFRLKSLLKEVSEKKSSMPTEREEIKDRIIMKLEDQLINTRIQLKETQLAMSRMKLQ